MLFSLLSQAGASGFDYVSCAVSDSHIYNLKMLVPGQTSFDKHTLYCLYDEERERFSINDIAQANLLVAGNPSSRIEDWGNNNIIILREPERSAEFYNHLSEIIRQNTVLESDLHFLNLLSADTLDDLLDQLSELLKNPFLLINLNRHELVHSRQPHFLEFPVWKKIVESGYCGFCFEFDRSPVFTSYTMKLINCAPPHSVMVSPVTIDGKIVAALLEFDFITELKDFHKMTVDMVMHLIIERNFKNDSAFSRIVNNDSEARAYIDLLNGKQQSYFSEKELAENPEIDTYNSYKNLVSSYRNLLLCELPDDTQECNHLLSCMKSLQNVNAFLFKNYIVGVFRNKVTNIITFDQSVKLFKKYSESCNTSLFVSEPFAALNKITDMFQQTLTCLRLYKETRLPNGVYFYDMFRFYDALKDVSKDEALNRYCHPTLLVLDRFDKAHNTEYFKTLRAFILNERNFKAAADELHIHRNTLSYRLSQIDEMSNLSIWNPEYYFMLSYSFRLYEYCCNQNIILWKL